MKRHSLISIIIPVYNRVSLVGKTLDSITAQTYSNWECIVVDDGSTDATKELMGFYYEKDERIKYVIRPQVSPKGANACRNYGFDVSRGEFINWFDSDDLMLPENLELKLKAFEEDVDFVIGNSINFDENGNNSRPYKLSYDEEITPENFITGKIGWITNDVLIRREKVLIRFNETLNSGQEYNFFSRLLYFTSKGKFLTKDTVLRRIHVGSIHQTIHKFETLDTQYFANEIIFLNDIKDLASKNIINRSLKRIIRFSYKTSQKFNFNKMQKQVLNLLFRFGRMRVLVLYLGWIIINKFSGKGYFLVKRSFLLLDKSN